MRIRRAGTLVVAAAVMVLAACSTGGAPPAAPSPDASDSTAEAPSFEIKLEDEEAAGDPKPGGRLSLNIRLDATELDPHKMSETSAFVITEQVYESLVSFYRGEIIPAIATDWEISEDGLAYTFTLRDDAYFHSGRQVTAEDVKYSLERIKDPETKAPRANSYRAIETVEVVDPTTVVLHLSEPSAPLLTILATAASSIVDREVVEAGGLNGTVDGGSGPFTIASRVPGQEIKLDAHEKYWEKGVPYLDGIDISFNPDDNARAAAVRSGTVDFLWRAAPEFFESLSTDEKLKWYGGQGSLSLHVRLNTTKAPFDDVRVRQAIFLALDRQEILDVANSGYGQPLDAGYLPPERFGALTEPMYGEPDIERAKELLAEAGYPDGFDANLVVISTSAFQVRSAEVEQQQLAKIGIDVEIQAVESNIASERVAALDFDMYQSGFGMTTDPDERFSASFSDGGGLNYGNWSDPEYEELVAEARTIVDPKEREELYRKAETILAERGPVAMTWVNADFDIVQKDVMNYRGDPMGSFRFYKHLWLDR